VIKEGDNVKLKLPALPHIVYPRLVLVLQSEPHRFDLGISEEDVKWVTLDTGPVDAILFLLAIVWL